MGLFMDLAAVLAPADNVLRTLKALGCNAECYSTQADRSLVLYEEPTGNFDRVQNLSRELGTAAFACHIHDADLWLYEFYLSGEQFDQFNTMPKYWGEITVEEDLALRGNAGLLAEHWPGLRAEDVQGYFLNWEDVGGVWNDVPSKAYPDDEYSFGDCWQLTDFLRRLGTPYPPDSP